MTAYVQHVRYGVSLTITYIPNKYMIVTNDNNKVAQHISTHENDLSEEFKQLHKKAQVIHLYST